FDPIDFLREHDLDVGREATLRILRRPGSTSRIVPWVFQADGEPLPVTARLFAHSRDLRYAVEVRAPSGEVLSTIEVSRPVRRARLDQKLQGAITGWHRAALVQRVLAWATRDPGRRNVQALDYAVDLGVLVEGTAALAVPRGEMRRLSRRNRTRYRQDGSPLGAPNHEADSHWPPAGSMDERP
ncbi:MAG: hypothetical protein ACC662_08265, partial [Planctomycetota bacterium]